MVLVEAQQQYAGTAEVCQGRDSLLSNPLSSCVLSMVYLAVGMLSDHVVDSAQVCYWEKWRAVAEMQMQTAARVASRESQVSFPGACTARRHEGRYGQESAVVGSGGQYISLEGRTCGSCMKERDGDGFGDVTVQRRSPPSKYALQESPAGYCC